MYVYCTLHYVGFILYTIIKHVGVRVRYTYYTFYEVSRLVKKVWYTGFEWANKVGVLQFGSKRNHQQPLVSQ